LTGGVRVDYFTQRRLPIFIPGREECAYCEETQTLLKEIAALSDKITLNVHEFAESTKEAARLGVDKVPGSVIRGALNRPLRFFGFPVGNELVPLVEGIIEASRGKVELGTETAATCVAYSRPCTYSLRDAGLSSLSAYGRLVMKLGSKARAAPTSSRLASSAARRAPRHSRRSTTVIDEREVLLALSTKRR
jgi:hypothetical protein